MSLSLHKFVHPITGITMTTKEAAKEIGIHPATLCNRYKLGQRGKHLWRPSEITTLNSTLPSAACTLKQGNLLRTIPSETKFERRLK